MASSSWSARTRSGCTAATACSSRIGPRCGDVVVSDEHSAVRWVDPVAMRAGMSDEVIDALADGDERVSTLVRRIRVDLDRYLRRVGRT
jgi:hypothetical protein